VEIRKVLLYGKERSLLLHLLPEKKSKPVSEESGTQVNLHKHDRKLKWNEESSQEAVLQALAFLQGHNTKKIFLPLQPHLFCCLLWVVQNACGFPKFELVCKITEKINSVALVQYQATFESLECKYYAHLLSYQQANVSKVLNISSNQVKKYFQKLFDFGFIIGFETRPTLGSLLLIAPPKNWERFVNIRQLGKLLSATTTSFTSNFTAYTTFSLPSHRISQGIPLIPIIATDLLASFSDSQREAVTVQFYAKNNSGFVEGKVRAMIAPTKLSVSNKSSKTPTKKAIVDSENGSDNLSSEEGEEDNNKMEEKRRRK